ncbi:MAG TPA: PilZ domain-containing protein [Novosphingobium sp.]
MSALKAHWEIAKSIKDGRGARRRKLSLEAQGTTSSGMAADVLIHNLSTTGLLIQTSTDLSIGEAITVDVPHAGTTLAVVMWNSGNLFGCEFVAPVPSAAVSASLLRNPVERPSEPAAVEEIPAARDNDYVDADIVVDEQAADRPKLPIRTRVMIIVGSSLLAWTLIIWAIARSF